jgi:hypothetical protein
LGTERPLQVAFARRSSSASRGCGRSEQIVGIARRTGPSGCDKRRHQRRQLPRKRGIIRGFATIAPGRRRRAVKVTLE